MKFPARHRCLTRSLLLYVALLICAGDVHELSAEPPAAIQTQIRALPAGVAFSQTRVGDIVQDNKGFLWFGTQYGLNRYDGVRVRQFLHASGDANSVGCSYIHALFKDRSGRLWISCAQSLDRYEPETQTFTHFNFPSLDGSPEVISTLLEDQDSSLWLGTQHGILHFNPQTGRVSRLSLHDRSDPSHSDEVVLWLDEDRAQHVWAMTTSSLIRFEPASGKIEKRIAIPHTRAVGSFHEDRWGNFWVIASYRLYTFDRERNRLTEISQIPALEMKTLGALHTMLEDADGDMWFGTESEGIIHMPHANRAPERLIHQIGAVNALPSNRITALLQDVAGDIWVGFHDTAPVLIQRNRTSSRVIAFQPWVTGGLKSTLTTSLFELKHGQLLIGTSGAMQLLEEETGKYSEPFPFLTPRDVFDLYRDRLDRLWFGTDNAIFRYNQNTKHVDELLRGSTAYRFLDDHSGRFWILSWDKLLLYSPVTDAFTSYVEAEHGENFYTIAESPDGTLWIGGSSGVKQVDVQTKLVHAYPYAEGSDRGPSDTRVNTLRFDTQGRLWVGTQSGLDLYDPREQRFQLLANPEDIGGQIISCILEDERHKLWMSSNQGLIKFDPTTHLFGEYSRALGVAPLDLSGWGACFKSDTGRLLFGGFGGIVSFKPEEITRTSLTPGVLLTNLIVNSRPARIGPSELLKRSLTFSDTVDLNHSQNDISIEFTALDFRDMEAEKFRYRLEGLSKVWVPVARGQHSLTFPHLDPKRYTLRLQASSLDGEWREPGVTLVIDIAKPWWETWWMYSLYLLCLCVAVWLGYCFRIRQLAAIFNAQTEGRIRERSALAHDLHDTLLQAFQGVILRFASTTSQTLDEDARRAELNSALVRAEMSLLEGREAIEALRTSPTQIKELAAAFEDVARDLNFLSPAEVEIQTNLRARFTRGYDVDEILQIGKEALRNALQHAQATHIQVRLTSNQRQFELLVADDGVGLPEKLVAGDTDPGCRGIRGMRERAERLGGSIGYSLRQGGGSELRLTLPNTQPALPIFERWRAYLKTIFTEKRP